MTIIETVVNKFIKPGFFRNAHNSGFIKNFATVLGVDVLVKASGFILLPLFLRLMSQEEFGLYNYFLSIIQVFSLVLNLGLYIPQSKLYHVYDTKEERGKLLFTIVVTLLLFLTVCCAAVIGLGWHHAIITTLFDNHSSYGQYKGILFFSLLVTVFSFMLTNYFYTSEKIKLVKRYNIYRIVMINLVAVSALYFFRGNAVYLRLSATYITELVLLCLFAIYLVKEMVPVFSRKMMLKSIKLGLPIMLSAIFGILVNFSDKFLLQKYGSLKELSNYYLAFSFASIIPLIFASLQNVWLPVFLKEKDVEKNFKKTQKFLSKLLLLFSGLAILIWLLFVALFWLSIIPHKYFEVVWILPILLVTQILASMTPLLSNYMIYFERTEMTSISGLVMSFASVGFGLWLVPIWGVYGAALTALIVNFVYLIIYYYLVLYLKRRHLPKTVGQ